jgi:hypothetical protein
MENEKQLKTIEEELKLLKGELKQSLVNSPQPNFPPSWPLSVIPASIPWN